MTRAPWYRRISHRWRVLNWLSKIGESRIGGTIIAKILKFKLQVLTVNTKILKLKLQELNDKPCSFSN